jgi:hypothetical protein
MKRRTVTMRLLGTKLSTPASNFSSDMHPFCCHMPARCAAQLPFGVRLINGNAMVAWTQSTRIAAVHLMVIVILLLSKFGEARCRGIRRCGLTLLGGNRQCCRAEAGAQVPKSSAATPRTVYQSNQTLK